MVAASHRYRLFFALWPADALRAQIAQITEKYVQRSCGRPIPAHNFHVTLAFLGEVSQARLAAAALAGTHTSAPPFEMALERIEVLRRSHVLCLSAVRVPPELIVLEQVLRARLIAQQFQLRAAQPLRPHLTLARNLPRWQPPAAIEPVRWTVRDFVLVASQLAPAGSIYSVLQRWMLTPPPADP